MEANIKEYKEKNNVSFKNQKKNIFKRYSAPIIKKDFQRRKKQKTQTQRKN